MSRTTANALLLLTAVIWGTTFVAQQKGMATLGPLAYTALRFALGALVVLPLALHEFHRYRRSGARLQWRDGRNWVTLGSLLFLGSVLQQIGVATTTVSNAGFLTGLYVPLVPILGWFILGQRPHRVAWLCAAASVAGTFLLSGGHLDAIRPGDLWVLASTAPWAIHVLWVGRLAAKQGLPLLVAFAQFAVCAALAGLTSLALETTTGSAVVAVWPSIVYAGVLSVGVAFTLQAVAQRYSHAAEAAVLLSSEILFAAIAGAVVLGERLTPTQLSGGLLIFASIVVVQVVPLMRGRTQNTQS